MKRHRLGLASLLLAVTACSGGGGGTPDAAPRDQIKIAGSSTVFPFAKAVADHFAPTNAGRPAPAIEENGTGKGIQSFCAGAGGDSPDIALASRRMRPEELRSCRANGVNDVVELQIGIDGIAFAHSPGGATLTLTRKQIYEALAANPYGQPQTKRTWKQVDASLPDTPILVYGPPVGDGTRDVLAEMILIPACEANADMQRLKTENPQRFTEVCTTLRSDAAFTAQGENDERTAMQLVVNPRALGIFGYSYLEKQGDRLAAIPIEGVTPAADTIGSGRYPASRPLFIYVKKAQLDATPGLREYVAEFVRAIAPGGYLAQIGLIPAPEAVRQATTRAATDMASVNEGALK